MFRVAINLTAGIFAFVQLTITIRNPVDISNSSAYSRASILRLSSIVVDGQKGKKDGENQIQFCSRDRIDVRSSPGVQSLDGQFEQFENRQRQGRFLRKQYV